MTFSLFYLLVDIYNAFPLFILSWVEYHPTASYGRKSRHTSSNTILRLWLLDHINWLIHYIINVEHWIFYSRSFSCRIDYKYFKCIIGHPFQLIDLCHLLYVIVFKFHLDLILKEILAPEFKWLDMKFLNNSVIIVLSLSLL